MDKQTLLQHLKDNPNTPQVSVANIKSRISLCDEAIMLGNRAKVDMNSFYGNFSRTSLNKKIVFSHEVSFQVVLKLVNPG